MSVSTASNNTSLPGKQLRAAICCRRPLLQEALRELIADVCPSAAPVCFVERPGASVRSSEPMPCDGVVLWVEPGAEGVSNAVRGVERFGVTGPQSSSDHPCPWVIALTENCNVEDTTRLLQAGIRVLVHAAAEPAVLRRAVEAGFAGQSFLCPRTLQTFLNGYLCGQESTPCSASALKSLTERQRDILRLIADGATTREIAGRFDLSVQTISKERARLGKALGADSVAELTKVAIQLGLSLMQIDHAWIARRTEANRDG